MLPIKNRLTKKKDFDIVFKKGESIKNGFLVFKILKNQLQENRFGFIVANKISNKSTIRNKIKRRLRAAVLKELDKNKNHLDIIIITLPGIEKIKFSEIENQLLSLFKKI